MGRPSVRSLVVASAAMVALAVGFATPRSAAACSSDQPTFDQAMAGAQAVAIVEVDLAANGEVQPGVPPLRVVEVLTGDPAPFLVGDPITGLCGDTIHYLFGDSARLIVAFGVPFYDQVIHPAWGRSDDGSLFGTAGNPSGVDTIEGVEAAIRTRFSAGPGAAEPVTLDSSWLVIAIAALAVVVGLWLAWRRSPQ